MARKKSKSQRSADGSRKLASGHGRGKKKKGSEAQKQNRAGSVQRTGSSKQRKG